MGEAEKAVEEGLPVADAVALDAHELHVGAGAEELVLKLAAHAVGDGQSDDERGDPGGDSGDGDGGDHADDGLTPFGSQVTRREKEFESHLATWPVR